MFGVAAKTSPNTSVRFTPVANEWRNNLELQLYIDYWEAVEAAERRLNVISVPSLFAVLFLTVNDWNVPHRKRKT